MRLEMNYREKNVKKHKDMEAKQYVTKYPSSLKKSKRKSKNTWRQITTKTR